MCLFLKKEGANMIVQKHWIFNYDLSVILSESEIKELHSLATTPFSSPPQYGGWFEHMARYEELYFKAKDFLDAEYLKNKPKYEVNKPYVREDRMDGVQSMADGKVYESKSEYYKSLKDGGYHIVDYKQENKPKTENIDWRSAIQESMR